MVKSTNKSNLYNEKNSFIEILERSIENKIPLLDLSTLSEFISMLVKYSKIKPACRSIENAYIILFICIIIQEKIKNSDSIKIGTILDSLGKIFILHKSTQKLTKKCLVFERTQDILNKSTKIVLEKIKVLKQEPEIFFCFQFLQVFTCVSFKIGAKTLLKIIRKVRKSSIFSFFTNDSIPVLPSKTTQKKTLVLDLDETLGHYDGQNFYLRPGVREFITKTSEKYEIVLYTSAQELYANSALELIDPEKVIIFRLYRQHLLIDQGKVVKDLRLLGRDLESVIIIDNEPKYFRNQVSNGIQIKSWTGDQADSELETISAILCNDSNENALKIVAKVNSVIIIPCKLNNFFQS